MRDLENKIYLLNLSSQRFETGTPGGNQGV